MRDTDNQDGLSDFEETLIWIFVALLRFGVPFAIGVYVGRIFW